MYPLAYIRYIRYESELASLTAEHETASELVQRLVQRQAGSVEAVGLRWLEMRGELREVAAIIFVVEVI